MCGPLATEGVGLGSSSGPVASRPPLGLGLLRRPGRCYLSPGRFHAWVSPHGRLASCSSGSLPSRVERLVSLQGASDFMTHFSPEGVVVFSGSGIAVRVLLLATSLTLTMVLPLTPVGLSVSAFSGWFSVLKVLVLKCQVLPFSRALTLLAYCLGLQGSCPVATLPGVSLWFFRTWWGSVELLRTSGGRVFCLIARLSPGLCFALAFWVFQVWVFSGSPSGSECSVLCFRHGCDVVLRDLPCSSVGRLHCTGPANARQIAWENVIACGGGQVFLVRLGRRIVGGACHSYLP